MKLEDFVADTITQIVTGLKKAQRELGADACINPSGLTLHYAELEGRRYDSRTNALEELVEFDIALTQEQGKGTAGGVGVFLGTVNLGSKGESQTKELSVSRVKFRVPVLFPLGPLQTIPAQTTEA